MTEFQLALTEHFENHNLDVYKNERGEMEFTREQIGMILGYENPGNAISDIHRRNREFLDRFSSTRNLRVGGKPRAIKTYGFKGFMAICRYSSQPIADRVMEFLIDLADRFRTGMTTSTPTLDYLTKRLDGVEAELFAARKIIDLVTTCSTSTTLPPQSRST